MADVHSKDTRSYNMSRIRSGDTTPEMIVRRFLHKRGFRYRLHVKELPGKPDLVLPKYNCVIQVHGCFWHGHKDCRYFKLPETRRSWWDDKILKTRKRDARNEHKLQDLEYNAIIVWECELKPANRDKRFIHLISQIEKNNQ